MSRNVGGVALTRKSCEKVEMSRAITFAKIEESESSDFMHI
jgi:hypothetical protein